MDIERELRKLIKNKNTDKSCDCNECIAERTTKAILSKFEVKRKAESCSCPAWGFCEECKHLKHNNAVYCAKGE